MYYQPLAPFTNFRNNVRRSQFTDMLIKFYLNKFLIPSMSNAKEKRSVWSNGFC